MVSQSITRDLLAGLPVAARLRSAGSAAALARWALVSTALAPLAMVAAWLAAEALQPAAYSPLESSISGLAALGATDRWIVTSALFLVGACYFVTAACLPRLRGPARLVLVIAAVSSVGIAYAPQPVHGSSAQHLAWTSLGAAAITIWPAFSASRAPSAPPVLRVRTAASVTATFLVLTAWLIAETQHGTALGLTERLVTGVQMTWPFFVALAVWRKPGDAPLHAGARAQRCSVRRLAMSSARGTTPAASPSPAPPRPSARSASPAMSADALRPSRLPRPVSVGPAPAPSPSAPRPPHLRRPPHQPHASPADPIHPSSWLVRVI